MAPTSIRETEKGWNGIEQVTFEALEFFSDAKNLKQKHLIKYLIPKLLDCSEHFSGGLVMDLSKFKTELTLVQKKFIRKVFKNPISVKISTVQVKGDSIFFFLKQFKQLTELIITLNSTEKIHLPSQGTKFDTIKITYENEYKTGSTSKFETNIAKILGNNIVPIKSLSLRQARINSVEQTLLKRFNLEKLSLTNIALCEDWQAEDIVHYIVQNTNLRRLKIAQTCGTIYSPVFEKVTKYFFETIDKRKLNLKEFAFNAERVMNRNMYSFRNLGPLRVLKVYYSIDIPIQNIIKILDTLRCLDKLDFWKVEKVIFVEYFVPTRLIGTMEVPRIEERMNRYREIIMGRAHKSISMRSDIKSRDFDKQSEEIARKNFGD